MVAYDAREEVSLTVLLLAKRTLPDTLLNGGNIASGELVEEIIIDKNGHIHASIPLLRS